MNYLINRLFTAFFLLFSVIVAMYIPLHASINNEIFFPDQTTTYSLQKGDFSVFKQQGLVISNYLNAPSVFYNQQKPESSNFDLLIDFNQNIFLQNYHLVSSNYQQKTLGDEVYGKFILGSQGIVLLPRRNSVFNTQQLGLQSFSISYQLIPYHTGEGTQTIFSYKKMDSKNHGSFTITIEEGVITYRFDQFFQDSSGEKYSFELREFTPVIQEKLENHSIVVNNQDRTIRIYRNGQENHVISLALNDGRSLFHQDNENETISPITIGQNAVFALGCFSIYNYALSGTEISQKREALYFETDIIELTENNIWLHEMQVEGVNLSDKNYRIAYRLQQDYFLPETSNKDLPWIYIDPQAKAFPQTYTTGRYIQWKFEYIGKTPDDFILTDIKTVFRETLSPATIQIASITPGDQKINIVWRGLPGGLVQDYIIYYGDQPNTYFGVAEFSPPSPIAIPIKDNPDARTFSYTLEGLENNKTYYISIRAKNIYGSYGKYSQEVSEMPSSVKNGLGYSIGR